MDLLEEYITYLKDNPKGYWFKRKLYGIGWVPARWQGWAVLASYLLVVLGLVLLTPADLPDELVLSHILIPVFSATALLLAICWRMGEPLRWQWGLSERSEW